MKREEKEEDGERTSPFIDNEYRNIHILVVYIFLHSTLLEGHEIPVTSNLN